MREKPHRSILKAITWRVLGTFDTMLISFIITGSLKASISIGFIELFTKMLLYYLHERVWSKLKIGIEEPAHPDYQI